MIILMRSSHYKQQYCYNIYIIIKIFYPVQSQWMQIRQKTQQQNITFIYLIMTESNKANKFSQTPNRNNPTCLHTPEHKPSNKIQKSITINQSLKQCPYHFNQPSHICLTCRRSICLRCAITYCQQHTIHPEQQILSLLFVDLQKLTIQPRIDDIQLKMKQSNQRQDYLTTKIVKMFEQIEQNFDQLKMMLDRKKQQILQYYQEQLAQKYLGQYKKYDEDLYQKRQWLQNVLQAVPNCSSIEQIDQLASIIKKQISSEAGNKSEISATKLILGKDKMKIHKIWSEQKLEKILYEIQSISYKLKDLNTNGNNNSTSFNNTAKKKRVTTEVSEVNKITPFSANVVSSKSPFAGILRSTSNSRFPSGRKTQI